LLSATYLLAATAIAETTHSKTEQDPTVKELHSKFNNTGDKLC
jgi:hypothetical protein